MATRHSFRQLAVHPLNLWPILNELLIAFSQEHEAIMGWNFNVIIYRNFLSIFKVATYRHMYRAEPKEPNPI